MKKLNKNNKGFSLVELLVVIAIMVVLVGVVAPTLLCDIPLMNGMVASQA